ncbi:MAG: Rieske 2Fe-2S domain-containing protein [Thermoguttaceae bacterium]
MNLNRRGLLRAIFGSAFALGVTGLAAVSALWAAAIARFMTPNVTNQPPRTFKAGKPADYADGSVETKYRQTHGVWIVRQPHPGRARIVALRTACTHLGCMTVWQESQQRFRCPCHGSAFTKEGINVAGPAPRPLERCAIRIADDGRLEIDTARTFRQDLGQWTDPQSFVEA